MSYPSDNMAIGSTTMSQQPPAIILDRPRQAVNSPFKVDEVTGEGACIAINSNPGLKEPSIRIGFENLRYNGIEIGHVDLLAVVAQLADLKKEFAEVAARVDALWAYAEMEAANDSS